MNDQWRIGDVTVTRVVENEGASDGSFLLMHGGPEFVSALGWLRPRFADDVGWIKMSVHSFVVESRGRRVIVDTGIGNNKTRSMLGGDRLNGPFMERLVRAGFDPISIDTVVCTHLHMDHVGWNTTLVQGEWRPTFGQARYLFGRYEWKHRSVDESPDSREFVRDSLLPVFDAGQVDLVDDGHEVTDEVWLVPSRGHTEGHMSVMIRSQGEEAVITGDLMHHPMQIAYPERGCHFDYDYDEALATRRGFVERHADRPILILGTHFASPTSGYIVSDGDRWRFNSSETAT
jgi:glyoxylase-like metal-dependent hydrolase (beta-lactamase superfamily II)